MIILDTNIISEMMKPSPSDNVISWLDQEEVSKLYITTITIAEISYGINALPEGNKRVLLAEAFSKTILTGFEHRIYPFDESSAYLYGKIMADRKVKGRPLSIPDGQICAIALSCDCVIATRNIRDFADCGIDIVNPFMHKK